MGFLCILGSVGRGDSDPQIRSLETQPRGEPSFQVKARRLKIIEHPNADALEIAKIDDYQVIVRKGEYETGELALYIPEAAILPERVISDLGLEGRLAGGTEDPASPQGKRLLNRVKAIKLRGVLSQGLVYKPGADSGVTLREGVDHAEELGITKYRPPIPIQLSGQVEHSQRIRAFTHIENIKKYPDVFKEGEPVVFTEKAHGTCCVVGLIGGELQVTSKGNAQQNRVLRAMRDERGESKNLYWRMADQLALGERLFDISERHGGVDVHLYSEILGVQDLMYGLRKGEGRLLAFDLRIGDDYVDDDYFRDQMREAGIETTPILYEGGFDRGLLDELASGDETITGSAAHLREGGVVKPKIERFDPELGRVILKVISPDYLVRGGDATEYE